MITAIRRAGETEPIAYEKNQFRITGGDGLLNLENMYREYCLAPRRDRATLVHRFARAWTSKQKQIPESFEDARPDLLPIVRERALMECQVLRSKVEHDKVPEWTHQVFGEHFALGLVYDLPEVMRYIVADDLSDWDVSFYEALEAAQQNLQEMDFGGYAQIGDGVYSLLPIDEYVSSRVILFDFIRSLEVEGDHVAIIPSRKQLLVTGTDDADGLALVAKLVEESRDEELRPMWPLALRLNGDDWLPWLPEYGHPQYESYKLFDVQLRGAEYDTQQQPLQSLYDKAGEEVFVASFSAMRHDETGMIISHCTWTDGVDSILPETDHIYFVRANPATNEGTVLGVALSDRVREVVGDLMEPLDLYPPRYRVRQFPNEEKLAEILSSA